MSFKDIKWLWITRNYWNENEDFDPFLFIKLKALLNSRSYHEWLSMYCKIS